eukprot:TRINITY_DN18236_c0_g1_i1.p1 TRINITY_DN18236_c0_g1~~TRINITY_DN18236_c0_g1_i1.p1  ORF type:complete len:130 (-),score=8.62 TRINITY_DN18236_c0_g1_i1:25-414(-)
MRNKKSPKTPSFPGHPKRQELIFFFTNQNTPNAPSIQIPFSPHFMTEPSAELHLFSRIYHLSKIANITHKPLDFLSLKSPPSIPKDLCMLSIVITFLQQGSDEKQTANHKKQSKSPSNHNSHCLSCVLA